MSPYFRQSKIEKPIGAIFCEFSSQTQIAECNGSTRIQGSVAPPAVAAPVAVAAPPKTIVKET